MMNKNMSLLTSLFLLLNLIGCKAEIEDKEELKLNNSEMIISEVMHDLMNLYKRDQKSQGNWSEVQFSSNPLDSVRFQGFYTYADLSLETKSILKKITKNNKVFFGNHDVEKLNLMVGDNIQLSRKSTDLNVRVDVSNVFINKRDKIAYFVFLYEENDLSLYRRAALVRVVQDEFQKWKLNATIDLWRSFKKEEELEEGEKLQVIETYKSSDSL